MGEFIKATILFGSGVFVMLLAGLAARAAWDRRWGHVGLDIACAGMIGLILEAVFRVPEIPPEWRSWTFLVLGIVGVISAIYIFYKGER